MFEIFCANQSAIDKIAQKILEKKERIFVLSGAVGSGKTTLVQAILRFMQGGDKKDFGDFVSGADFVDFAPLQASSPTFGIRNEYGNISQKNGKNYGEVFHYDLYKTNLACALELGLLEWLSQQGWHFIEWGEEILPILKENGFECVEIVISENLEDLGNIQNAKTLEISKEISKNHATQSKDSKRFYKFVS